MVELPYCGSVCNGSDCIGSEKPELIPLFNGFEAENTYTNYFITKYEKQTTV